MNDHPARDASVRLQKFLSDAGVASRRHAEELILDGRVLVNDKLVDSLPAFVDPQRDRVVVDGTRVRVQPLQYFIMNKPKGVVCSTRDPSGRRRAVDFLPDFAARVFVVGRLDAESSGLLLLTNDGEMAQQITHPRYGISKVYRVEVRGQVSDELPALLRKGVYLAEGLARATNVKLLHRSRERSALEITLREARNRQVRRMLARLGHPVKSLWRISIGPIQMRGLPVGGVRLLGPGEIAGLRRALHEAAQAPQRPERSSAAAAPQRPRSNRPPRGTKTRGVAPRAAPRSGREPAPGPDAPRRRIVR